MSVVDTQENILHSFDNEELMALARFDLDQGRVDQALAKIKKILQTDAGNADTLSMGGKVYAQLRLFDKAKNCFKQFLEIKPDEVLERFQLGMVHFDSGDREGALAIWNELLEKQPTHPPALFYKGLVLAQQNKEADAKQCLSILLQSAPADNLYFGRAKELLQALDRGDNAKIADNSGSDSAAGNNKFLKDAYKIN